MVICASSRRGIQDYFGKRRHSIAEFSVLPKAVNAAL